MARPPIPTVEIQIGTEGDDSMIGFAVIAHDFDGRGGNDTIEGTPLSDTLIGGEGNDVLLDRDDPGATAPSDTLLGGAGNDAITGASGAVPDLVDGGSGFDSLRFVVGFDGDLTMTGRFGDGGTVALSNGQVFTSIEFADLAVGNGDNQLFTGRFGGSIGAGSGDDTFTGAGGSDRFNAGAGDNLLRGRGGDDVLVAINGGNQIFGGAGDDRLIGSGILRGNAGNDLLGGFGDSTLIGGRGADEFVQSFVGLARVLDFDAAEGDRVRAVVQPPIDPDAGIGDPFLSGFLRVVDGADGAELQFRAFGNERPDELFATVSIFVGVTAAELLPNVLIA